MGFIEAVAELTAEISAGTECARLYGNEVVQAYGQSEPPSDLFSVRPGGLGDVAAKNR